MPQAPNDKKLCCTLRCGESGGLVQLAAGACPSLGMPCLGGCLALGFGVDLSAQKDGDADQVEPEDQNGYPSEGAVGLAVVAELGHIEREAQRRGQEYDSGDGPPGLTHCHLGVSRFGPK